MGRLGETTLPTLVDASPQTSHFKAPTGRNNVRTMRQAPTVLRRRLRAPASGVYACYFFFGFFTGTSVGADSPWSRAVMLAKSFLSSSTKNIPPRPFWLLEHFWFLRV